MKKKLAIFSIALAILGLVGWGLWSWVTNLSPAILATWAVLATLALPIVGWASWTLGHVESRGVLKGLDTGIDKVASAAVKLKVKPSNVQVAVLPQLPPVIHRRLANGEGEVVDL